MSKVLLYGTPTCEWCTRTRQFFLSHHVAYQDIDVSTDLAKQHEMIAKSGQAATPVVVINPGADEAVVVGYNPTELAAQLGLEA